MTRLVNYIEFGFSQYHKRLKYVKQALTVTVAEKSMMCTQRKDNLPLASYTMCEEQVVVAVTTVQELNL